MRSEDLLRRMEALNGGPLRDPPRVDRASDGLDAPIAEQIVSGEPAEVIPRPARSRRPAGAAVSLADALPGEVRSVGEYGPYFCMEQMLADHADWCANLGQSVAAALPGLKTGRIRRQLDLPSLQAVLFLDVETLGLEISSPIFLIGLIGINAECNLYCTQLLARDLAEERAIVAAAADLMRSTGLLITFNGRGYDLPLLHSRAREFGVPLIEPSLHVDLLLEARRRYSRKLPNCRLQTLEARLCGRERQGDVPGSRIPGVYRQFVKTGNAALMERVVHHNLLDLATTAELFTQFFG